MTAPSARSAPRPSTIANRFSLGLLAFAACAGFVGCGASDDEPPPTFGGPTGSVAGSSSGAPSNSSAGTFSAAGTFSSSGGAGTFPSGGGGNGGTAGTGTTGGLNDGGTAAGGTPSVAGSGGGGGSDPAGCGKSTGADPMIDDFEDVNGILKAVDGRSGIWENFDDTSLGGSYTPKFPTALLGKNGSAGYCVAVSGYSDWGANLVANMSAPKCGYDASAYKGVCFSAKGSVDAGGPIVFAVGTSDTVPETSGGKCVTGCNAHYQLKLTGEAALTDEYKEYCVEWAQLALPTVPQPKPLDATGIVQMEWKFPAGASKSTDGEICIDDVRFLQ